jgi:hypothetical protein
MCKR